MSHPRKKRTTPDTRPTGEVFSSCAELPLTRFMRALVHKDLGALVKRGTVGRATLRKAWDRIQIEYIEASSGKEEKAQLWEELRCAYEESRINRCRLLVAYLWDNASEEVARCLREEDFDVPQADAPDEERHTALKLILNLLSGDELRVELSRKEISGNDTGKKVEITEVWFFDILIAAGEVVGHGISAENISTLAFCRYYLRLKEAAKAHSKPSKTQAQ